MAKTLLEQAKGMVTHSGGNRIITEGEVELAVSWCKNEISSSQVTQVLNENGIKGNAVGFVSIVLRDAICKGEISIS